MGACGSRPAKEADKEKGAESESAPLNGEKPTFWGALKPAGSPAVIANVFANLAAWLAVEVCWCWAYAGMAWGLGCLGFGLLVCLYATLWVPIYQRYGPTAAGLPMLPLAVLPVLAAYQAFSWTSPGGVVALNVPWWQLLLASAYRAPLEINFFLGTHSGTLPWALAVPCEKASEPYALTAAGRTVRFARGINVDGAASVVLGLPLALWSYGYEAGLWASHPPEAVLWAYTILGFLTLGLVLVVVVSNLPGPHVFAGYWQGGPDTAAFYTWPVAMLPIFASQLGFIVFSLSLRKLIDYY